VVLHVQTWSCYAHRYNDLEEHSSFSSTIYSYSVLGTSLLWRSTVAFTYLKIKSTKCLCLLPVVLVFSCYFGLGLKNLVLFTSQCVDTGTGRAAGVQPNRSQAAERLHVTE